MRAERLLRIAHLLQTRGRLTEPELAAELGVSTRTIHRDLEALSVAGVPVYSTRGQHGGWSMLDTYRSSAAGLTPQEALTIVVGHQARVLDEVGLGDSGRAVSKLLRAMPAEARRSAERARQRIHLDSGAWAGARGDDPVLRKLQQATWEDRVVAITYGGSRGPFPVCPLGLVAKGSVWYLVALRDGMHRTYRVDRIREADVTARRFDRPAGFDLAEHWQRAAQEYTDSLPSFPVRLRLRGDALARARWIWAKTKAIGEPDGRGWAVAELDFEDRENALQSIRTLGNHLEVLAPDALRRAAVRDAEAFVRRNRRS